MPLFDLGNDLKVSQTLNAGLEQAYGLTRQVLESYKQHGFRVRFTREREPTELAAECSDSDGTRIVASVKLTAEGPTRSRVAISLTGKVYVGGIRGRLATDDRVQDAALKMLKDEIKQALRQNGLAAAIHAIHQRERLYARAYLA